MNQTTFVYNYSAKVNAEVEAIRKKYLPQSEGKLDELKRLDGIVQNAGVVESLCAGIGGMILFGFGLCLTMQIILTGTIAVVLGVLIGIIAVLGMFAAYPIYRKVHSTVKAKYTPRILELTEDLSNQ